jgi:mannose-6-phosphate isomerase-like protein (cupin superfamily)
LVIKNLAEKKVSVLPAGALYWRIENFATLAQAKAGANSMGLVAESAGKIWLFTLGSSGGSTPGGTKVAELGPIPRISAPEYILRINEATGAPGSVTSQHTHPGSEAFYVLAGEQTIRTAKGTIRVKAGQPETGYGADNPMQVSSTGSTDEL